MSKHTCIVARAELTIAYMVNMVGAWLTKAYMVNIVIRWLSRHDSNHGKT